MCEEFVGCKQRNGYGSVRRKGRTYSAHRLRFYEVFGWWPAVVRHTCDNRACINPWHLLPGTQADNLRDMRDRGRAHDNTLNPGLPNARTSMAEYHQERRRRIKEGSWTYRI